MGQRPSLGKNEYRKIFIFPNHVNPLIKGIEFMGVLTFTGSILRGLVCADLKKFLYFSLPKFESSIGSEFLGEVGVENVPLQDVLKQPALFQRDSRLWVAISIETSFFGESYCIDINRYWLYILFLQPLLDKKPQKLF